jgi:hypothetical protein
MAPKGAFYFVLEQYVLGARTSGIEPNHDEINFEVRKIARGEWESME